ncbi:DMT family transporter [Clostridium tyrobutyricum]|jgi:drug/metabolite transporter (DMT)-like permease|uniref:DMT family transporter n=1 Tax=Clostridium tyrobutyricum TaxID=1519 RepID=UPI0002D46BB0|nr:DMT family transporter [Clostridium tyrobutyricum]MBR9649224.1 DMT family transporter [Clostridium tyrobutyricum]MBV4417585.1 DMT family transporter [Clostridium tyrobutyricum]MBV4418478.1 DMT family transporter [Clostridium tyrobutyricum]MBV4423104.1 DMT family transporter [Clostridium tyrobutyricum]MBV4426538.1 DMT family transporter [Clostridium tyrobutyricum]
MKYKIQLILSMIIFGTIGLVVRHIELSSSELALLSSAIGCLFLICVFLSAKKRFHWDMLKNNFILLFFSGVALGGNWIFLYASYQYTTVTNSTLAYYFAPVIVIFCSPILLHEKLSIKKGICIFISLLGLVMVVGNGMSNMAYSDFIGIVLGLIAAIFYASLMLINKFIHNMDKLELTIIQLAIVAIFLFFYVFFKNGLSFFSISASSIPFIAILGIVNTGIGFWLFFSGMEKLSGQSIAMLSYVDPLVAVAISGIVLCEQMTTIQVIGGILLLGSTFISEVRLDEFHS